MSVKDMWKRNWKHFYSVYMLRVIIATEQTVNNSATINFYQSNLDPLKKVCSVGDPTEAAFQG